MERKINVFASYIKSKKNKIANFGSIKTRKNLECSIQGHIILPYNEEIL